jgi:AcrR family transcriptional regulator
MTTIRRAKTRLLRKPAPKRGQAATPEYHHGDLQEALIAATEEILAKEGAESFTLREVARRAGVSPAAPSHHFGNATGLLVVVALRGYAELTRMLQEAGASAATPVERLHAQGAAYVRFALQYPGRFEMMFSHRQRLADDDRLKGAGKAAYAELEHTLEACVPEKNPQAARLAAVAAWSAVHGFAKLAVEGKFDQSVDGKGEKGREKVIKAILEPMLAYLWPVNGKRKT